MHWKPVTAAELEANPQYGPEDFPEPQVEVLDDNWFPLEVYSRHSTQWRVGFNGPYALDYGVIHHYLDRKGVHGHDFDGVMGAIAIIEQAALAQMQQ